MLAKLSNFLFGNVNATFTSKLSIDNCVKNLRASTKRTVFSSLFAEAAVGKVEQNRVRLRRVLPFFSNSFKPVFVGRFLIEGEKVILDGKFTMFLSTKIFMTIWFGFALLAPGMAVTSALATGIKSIADPAVYLFTIFGLGFILFGLFMVKVGWRLSRKDIDYLSSVIRQSLECV